MKTLFGQTFSVLGRALELRGKRHAVIAANVANVDTPGYRAKELPFKEIMKEEFQRQGSKEGEIQLQRTHQRHFPLDGAQKGEGVRLIKERGTPNPVDIDVEMAKLLENNLQYQATIQALIKHFDLIRAAVTEGGRG